MKILDKIEEITFKKRFWEDVLDFEDEDLDFEDEDLDFEDEDLDFEDEDLDFEDEEADEVALENLRASLVIDKICFEKEISYFSKHLSKN